MIEGKLERLKEAEMTVSVILAKAEKQNPEAVAVLEAENARHIQEIRNLQHQIGLARRTTRDLGVLGGGKYFLALGHAFKKNTCEIQRITQEIMDTQGKKLTKDMKALLKHNGDLAEDLEAFADNAINYAHDNGVNERQQEKPKDKTLDKVQEKDV